MTDPPATTKRAADRQANEKERQLKAGVSHEMADVTWKEVREAYELKVFPPLRQSTRAKAQGTFNKIEQLIDPDRIASLDETQISRFEIALRKQGLRPYTVKGHISQVLKILQWAKRNKFLARVPEVDIPPASGMKGRPITSEEFDRMIHQVPTALTICRGHRGKARRRNLIVKPDRETVQSYVYLLKGLWLSGLRLNEALQLNWDEDTGIMIDLKNDYPMLWIRGQFDKTGQDRILPLAPEFSEMILAVPPANRTGYFFNPLARDKRWGGRLDVQWVSKIICRIGELANVKVADGRREKGTKPKFASAHDFRRAFGYRWAQRVLPPVLQELMRHDDIKTTMEFYAGRHAGLAAKAAHEALEGILANNRANNATSGVTQESQKH